MTTAADWQATTLSVAIGMPPWGDIRWQAIDGWQWDIWGVHPPVYVRMLTGCAETRADELLITHLPSGRSISAIFAATALATAQAVAEQVALLHDWDSVSPAETKPRLPAALRRSVKALVVTHGGRWT